MSSDLNTDEQRLREMLDSSVSDVRSPAHTEDRARSTGRRIRTRRRIGVGLSAAAVAAVVAVGLPNVIGGGGDDRGRDAAVPATSTQAQSPESEAWWDMPASEMAELLSSLLPEGVELSDPELVNTDAAPGEPEEEEEMTGYLVATLTTADGPGKVNMVLAGHEATKAVGTGEGKKSDPSMRSPVEKSAMGKARYSCDPRWVIDLDSCTVIKDDTGTVIGQVMDTTKNGVRDLGVTMAAPNGGTVMIDVANTLDNKWPDGATPSSPRVALTRAQLQAIASDPAWTD